MTDRQLDKLIDCWEKIQTDKIEKIDDIWQTDISLTKTGGSPDFGKSLSSNFGLIK